MSAIGGLLGVGGGVNGTGLPAPTPAGITPAGGNLPATIDQLQNSYSGVQNSMQSQQGLLAAIQAQNGLGNQSQVYNQLQGVANGTGPNPAQAMLNQATGQNVQNQAAMMAGQRGAGSNPALIARQAAMQGAGIQQNSAGQAATLQAQQSLGALGQAGNMANTQAANQIGQTNANTAAQQAEQANLLNSLQGYNNANVGMQSNMNNIYGQLANTTMQGQQGVIGGIMKNLGTMGGMMGSGGGGGGAGGMAAMAGAEGGEVPEPIAAVPMGAPVVQQGPQSEFGQFLTSGVSPGGAPNTSTPTFGSDSGADALYKGFAGSADKSDQKQKPNYAGPDSGVDMADKAAYGGNVGHSLKTGGGVPGQAKVSGNSYSNDTVKALLSPGEVVIDRETMADKGPAGQMARTLSAIIAAKKKGRK